LWSAQLEANIRNHKGWPHARRSGVVQFGGSVDDGTVAITQGARAVTGTGTAFSTDMVGWRFSLQTGQEEIYTVVARGSATSITLDRPFEGETVATGAYRIYDALGVMPADYHATESIVMEYAGRKMGEGEFGYMRGVWPKPIGLGSVVVTMLAQPITTARWSDTKATLVAGDATVVFTETLPEWIIGRHLKVAGEDVLYRIASRTDDNNLELSRVYNGDNEGSSKTVYIDPAGCYQLEVAQAQEDRFALKLQYFAGPEEHVNDTDLIEGGDDYAMMLVEMSAASLLASQPRQVAESFQNRIRTLQRNASNKLQALIEGKKVSDEAPVARDIRFM